ncbi:MAG: ABC-F family ATP-binding cassette domain-containing protein [bacterium]
MILACNNISKSYGVNNILNNISLNINEKEKIALVGVNGAGKSTLFKILTGELSYDDGEVIIPKNTKIGYFSQSLELDESKSIFEELLLIFKDVIDMEQRLRFIESQMSIVDQQELDTLMVEYQKISDYLKDNNCFDYNSRIKGILKGLGFSEDDFYKNIKLLSGGQKTRVALGKILLQDPDLLLLDEPTNHLDINSIQWLENYLKGYSKSVLIISHDRYFLNKIINKVIELENNNATIYSGNYNSYYNKKQVMRQVLLKQYLDQQKEIKKQEASIEKLRSFNREKSVKRAENKEKALTKMDKIVKPESLPDKMRLSITPKKESGNDVLVVDSISKSFSHTLFSDISFDVKKGDKIALIGANGIGKTTLLKIIMNKLQYDNYNNNTIHTSTKRVKLGSNVEIGYYDQEQENLNLDKTIFQEIADTFPNLKNLEIRNALAIFVFTGDDIFKKISTLSGGEKGRVALAKIMLSNANFLILDEPTNHLDIVSKEILENALNNYTGTYMYISHDRFFINNTATKVFELTKDSMNVYLGNYDYYLEKLEKQAKESDANSSSLSPTTSTTNITTSDNKLDWKAQKEAQAEARKKETLINKIELQIEKLEEQIKEADHLLTLEEVYTNGTKSKEVIDNKTQLENQLEELFEQWEELS